MKRGILIALALALPASSAVAQAHSTATTVTHHSWKAEHAQGRAVLAWVAAHAPDFAPIGQQGVVSVERVQHFALTAQTRTSPPGGLPEKGLPGEEYSVQNTLPDGTVQSWTFQWTEPSTGHGGSWVIIGYEYKHGNDPLNIK